MRHKTYAVNVDDMLEREISVEQVGADHARVTLTGATVDIVLGPSQGAIRSARIDGDLAFVAWEREAGAIKLYLNGVQYRVELSDAATKRLRDLKAPAKASSEIKMKAPMPGVVQAVRVTVGQAVVKGMTLCVLEAMKMQNDIKADRDGQVREVLVKAGQTVKRGDVLIVIA